MIRIARADLNRPEHQAAVLQMTRAYAQDPMGNGSDLTEAVQSALIPKLQAHPTTLIFLAFDNNEPIGIATCFVGFSTFAAQPLINVHDLHVLTPYQRRGIGRQLLAAVEAEARMLGCCKLTLEVQENNHGAQALYSTFGFASGQYEPQAGCQPVNRLTPIRRLTRGG
jgi:ribosomal protein S18 acetylase RimI-like enzyme